MTDAHKEETHCPECGHDYVGSTDASDCKVKPYAPDDPTICACDNAFHEPAVTAKAEQRARELIGNVALALSPETNQWLADRIAAELTSRDTEIREVLDGLQKRGFDDPCWCGCMPHQSRCRAARDLYAKLQLSEPASGDS